MPSQNNVTTVLSMDTLHQTARTTKDAMYVLQNIKNGKIFAPQIDTAITVEAVTPPIRGNALAIDLNKR